MSGHQQVPLVCIFPCSFCSKHCWVAPAFLKQNWMRLICVHEKQSKDHFCEQKQMQGWKGKKKQFLLSLVATAWIIRFIFHFFILQEQDIKPDGENLNLSPSQRKCFFLCNTSTILDEHHLPVAFISWAQRSPKRQTKTTTQSCQQPHAWVSFRFSSLHFQSLQLWHKQAKKRTKQPQECLKVIFPSFGSRHCDYVSLECTLSWKGTLQRWRSFEDDKWQSQTQVALQHFGASNRRSCSKHPAEMSHQALCCMYKYSYSSARPSLHIQCLFSELIQYV